MLTVVREVCARFGLGEPISTTEAGGTRNTSFVVQTDLGKWVVRRRFPGYSDPDRISFDHSTALFLAQRGVPVMPPRADADGATVWRHDDDVWEVYPFAEGHHLRDGDRRDSLALAESLARFHDAGSSFDGRYDKLGPRGETDPDHLLESIEKARADAPDAGSALDSYKRAILKAAGELTSELYLSLPHTLVHGDVQPANIVMDDGRLTAFLDLDWCAWRPRVYDLCFALLCCCAAHERPLADGDVWALTQSPDLAPDLAREFLQVYQDRSTPFIASERAALAPQLALSWCHVRVDNSLKVPANQRRAFLERGEKPVGSPWRAAAWLYHA
jgi:Ser/Thr protein kinase RdoA (MazF antagonist)